MMEVHQKYQQVNIYNNKKNSMVNKVRFVDSNITISPGANSGGGGSSISSSYALSSSHSDFATSASYADYAVSASYEIVKEVSSSYADFALSSSHAVTASYALNAGTGGSGIFTQTGSYYATTNDLQITGSFKVSGSVDIAITEGSAFTVTETDKDQTGRLDFFFDDGDPTLEIEGRSSVAKLVLSSNDGESNNLKIQSDGQVYASSVGPYTGSIKFLPNGIEAVSVGINSSPFIGSQTRPFYKYYMAQVGGQFISKGSYSQQQFLLNSSATGTQRSDGLYNQTSGMRLIVSGSFVSGDTGYLRNPSNQYLQIQDDSTGTGNNASIPFRVGKSGSLAINLNQSKGFGFTQYYTASAMVHVEAEPNFDLNLFQGNDVLGNNVFEVDRDGNLTVDAEISASGDLRVRDGRFSRDGGAAEVEIIASEIAGGIIGTQTSDNLLFRRFNINKFTISQSRNVSNQRLDVEGQVSASTYLGDGSQLTNLPETNPKYLIYQTGSSPNNIQPISGSNLTQGNYSVIGGGLSNFVSESLYATIGGGTENTASACGVTIGGGCKNKATCQFYSSILGGLGNQALAAYSSIGGGSNNQINSSGASSTIAGGSTNCITQTYSAIGGGYQNCITGNSDQSVVAGGRCNIIDGNPSNYSLIGGGFNNNINTSEYSGILGGEDNTISNHTSSFIIGSNIIANASCTTFVNNLNVSSSITASGTVSASAFIGDGSQLENLPTQDPFPYTGDAVITGSLIAQNSGDSVTINAFPISSIAANKAIRIQSQADQFGNGIILDSLASNIELTTPTSGKKIYLNSELTDVAGDAQISGSLTISGSLLNTGTVTLNNGTYTLTGTQQFILIDPSGGDVTVNMPDAATYPGREIRFKLTQAAGANTVTLQRQGVDTIDGATTYTDLDIQYESISTVSDGSTGWFIF